MKSTHHITVNASVDHIYAAALAPEKWLTFMDDFRGLEAIDQIWPQEGSTCTARIHAVGPWDVSVRQTVVEHQRGRRLVIYQEALGGAYTDTLDLLFEPQDGVTAVTLIESQDSRRLLARPLVTLMWPLSYLDMRRTLKKLKAVVEDTVGAS